MTRDEAIEILSRPRSMKNVPDDIMEAHEMSIKALEQQACGDCISRQAVLGLFAQNADAIRPYSKTWEEVKALPSVNPQPKIGYWIKHDNGAWWECSKCHAERAYGNEYCPDCGSHNGDIAKLVEPQESEVKE